MDAGTVSDDNTHFAGGNLTVQITANAHANDVLGIKNVGIGANQISVSGNSVYHSNQLIGTFSGGTFLTAGSHTITVTAIDKTGNSTVKTAIWTITDVDIVGATATEMNGSTAVDNTVSLSSSSHPTLWILGGHAVDLATIFAPTTAFSIVPSDVQLSFLDSAGTTYAMPWSASMRFTPPTPAPVLVEIALDENRDGVFDRNAGEYKLWFNIDVFSFANVTIADARVGNGPVESPFPLVANEHLEIGGQFEFSLRQTGTMAGIGSVPTLTWLAIGDGVITDDVLGSGGGSSFVYAFSTSDVTGYTGHHVEVFYDENQDGSWDPFLEEGRSSQYFIVKALTTPTLSVAVSDAIGVFSKANMTQAQLHALVDPRINTSFNMALSRDSADDHRALIRPIIGTITQVTIPEEPLDTEAKQTAVLRGYPKTGLVVSSIGRPYCAIPFIQERDNASRGTEAVSQ